MTQLTTQWGGGGMHFHIDGDVPLDRIWSLLRSSRHWHQDILTRPNVGYWRTFLPFITGLLPSPQCLIDRPAISIPILQCVRNGNKFYESALTDDTCQAEFLSPVLYQYRVMHMYLKFLVRYICWQGVFLTRAWAAVETVSSFTPSGTPRIGRGPSAPPPPPGDNPLAYLVACCWRAATSYLQKKPCVRLNDSK